MENFTQIALVFVTAFAVTYITVPFSKWIGRKIGALDHPGKRRVNTEVIPRCGGISLYLGLLAGCGVLWVGCTFFGWNTSDLYTVGEINSVVLLIGVSAMFCVGLVDDIVQLSAPVKFVGQIVASLIVVSAGVTVGAIRGLGEGYYELGWLNVPVSVLYLVVFVNITNLIDGLDGLASGVAAICAAGLCYLVAARGSLTLMLVCVALIAVCLAFLRYNFYPATVFMGDSGALLLGLVLGIVSIVGVVRTQSFVVMLVPLVIAGVPVLDTIAAIIRRLVHHQSIGTADAGHVHHRLLKRGMGQIRSVLVLWAITAAAAVAGCALSGATGWARFALLVALVAAAFVLLWKLGLSEKVMQHHYRNKGKVGPRYVLNDGGSLVDAEMLDARAAEGSALEDAPLETVASGQGVSAADASSKGRVNGR